MQSNVQSGIRVALFGRVLRGETERVPAHRMEDIVAAHPAIPSIRVRNRVVANVSHVEFARRIRVHSEDVRRILDVVGRPIDVRLVPRLLPRRSTVAWSYPASLICLYTFQEGTPSYSFPYRTPSGRRTASSNGPGECPSSRTERSVPTGSGRQAVLFSSHHTPRYGSRFHHLRHGCESGTRSRNRHRVCRRGCERRARGQERRHLRNCSPDRRPGPNAGDRDRRNRSRIGRRCDRRDRRHLRREQIVS